MHSLGYSDFEFTAERYNIGKQRNDTISYLNSQSIKLINEYYEQDFKLFGYEMIH